MVGLENEKNKYLLFLDADISIHPFLIENLQRTIEKRKFKMIKNGDDSSGNESDSSESSSSSSTF